MKKLIFLFLIISSTAFAQDPKIEKATIQTVHQGASPVSSTTYTILISKVKKCNWSIDSLVSISSGQNVKFNIARVNDPLAASPEYYKAAPESLKKGNYQITFGTRKQHEGGRRGAPQNLKADTTNIEGGVIVYYTIKKKNKQIKIDNFERLENIDAP
jgi:hypothetical protein